jgi:hypothetical protein
MEDKVATLQNDEVVYCKPNNIYHYPIYKGNLFTLKDDNTDCSVTSEHRLYTKDITTNTWKLININEINIIENPEIFCKNMDTEWSIDVNNIKVEEYQGPVFCLSVPGEVFYIRRNGKSIWTGNSRGSGNTQNLNRQPTEGRSRSGGLRVGEKITQNKIACKSEYANISLVRSITGDMIKLRGHPNQCKFNLRCITFDTKSN